MEDLRRGHASVRNECCDPHKPEAHENIDELVICNVSDRGIIFRHMLPNAMVATLTFLPFILCSSITTLTSLDFLGFGLPLGSPSLGELLLQGKNNLQAPWLGITAFISVAMLLSLLIFIGEAVRDAFDPNKAI